MDILTAKGLLSLPSFSPPSPLKKIKKKSKTLFSFSKHEDMKGNLI